MRALVFLLSLVSFQADATSFAPREFTETVADAPIIVRGKIGSSYAHWALGQDGVRRIYTYSELALDEVFRGDIPRKSIQVREMGGEKDGVGMDVPGAARFETGEDVVLFLQPPNSDSSYDVKGLMMAKLNVKKDKNGQEYLDGPAIQVEPGKIYHDHEAEHLESERPRWTLAALKALVGEQGQAPQSANSTSQGVKKPIPTVSELPQKQLGTENAPSATKTIEAEESQERNSSWGFWFAITFVTLGVGIAVWLLRRRS